MSLVNSPLQDRCKCYCCQWEWLLSLAWGRWSGSRRSSGCTTCPWWRTPARWRCFGPGVSEYQSGCHKILILVYFLQYTVLRLIISFNWQITFTILLCCLIFRYPAWESHSSNSWFSGTDPVKEFLLWIFFGMLQMAHVQSDRASCAKPPVDFETKVPFWPGLS